MSTLKIGFDISDLHTGRADGTTRFTFELAKRFPASAPEHEWIYFSSGEPSRNYKLLAVAPPRSGAMAGRQNPKAKLRISPWPKYWTQSRLPWDLYKEKPDVLLMPIQQLPFVRPGRMKTVAVVHDLAFHVYPGQFTYKDWVLQHVFTAYAVREADEIVAVSRATSDDIARYYGRVDGVHVVHHGLDHEKFRRPDNGEYEDSWERLKKWQGGFKKPYILYVGQIQPRKNLGRLIEAFEELGEGQLVLAGAHGWLNKPIYEQAGASSLAESILMPGRVPEPLLPALYWHASVFVLPSLYEGFGMPLLEAMGCGCPVVTSSVSAMPEVAGGAAVLIDPLNTRDIARGIRVALKRRDGLIQAGWSRAREFSWDTTAKKTLALLTSV